MNRYAMLLRRSVQLLVLALLAAPAFGQVFTFSGDTTGGPTWNRPDDVGDGTSGSCELSDFAPAVPYGSHTFSVAIGGTYKVEVDYDEFTFAGKMALYEAAFDSADPCAGLIALDDFNTGGIMRIENANLTAGTSYIIVVTGFFDFSVGPYSGDVDLPFVVEEIGDAGDLVSAPGQDARTATGGLSGTLSTIGTDRDCFLIYVSDPSTFSASVSSFGGGPTSLATLTMFDESLNAIVRDPSFLFESDGGVKGDYYLCITQRDFLPRNADGEWPFGYIGVPFTGDAVLDSWDSGEGGTVPYLISLSGGVGAIQSYDLDVTATSPLHIPPGFSVTFDYTIENKTASPVTGTLWGYVRSIVDTGAIILTESIRSGTLPAGATVSDTFSRAVPSIAPEGVYYYTFNIGIFSSAVVDTETIIVIVDDPDRFGPTVTDLLAEAKRSGDAATYDAVLSEYLERAKAAWSIVEAMPVPPVEAAVRTESVGAYPNPFARSTEIAFALDKASNVSLVVYDVRGREVARLVEGTMEAGQHNVTFDAASLPSGVYVYRLATEAGVETGRITLIR